MFKRYYTRSMVKSIYLFKSLLEDIPFLLIPQLQTKKSYTLKSEDNRPYQDRESTKVYDTSPRSFYLLVSRSFSYSFPRYLSLVLAPL